MEQITRKDGVIYYGDKRCLNIDDAYGKFRDDYHRSIGRQAFSRLDRLGQRKERIHGFGFCFTDGGPSMEMLAGGHRLRYRILGLLLMCYCRIIGVWDYPELTDEQFDDWFDWVFSAGKGTMTQVGKNDKVGRTSKRLKTRYR